MASYEEADTALRDLLVRQTGRRDAAELGGKVGDGRIEVGVGIAPGEQARHMRAKGVFEFHVHPDYTRLGRGTNGRSGRILTPTSCEVS